MVMMRCEQLNLSIPGGEPFTLDCYCPEIGSYQPIGTSRAGIVLCAGGGYTHVADREMEPVALAFAARGYNVYALHYHVAPSRYPIALTELALTVAYVRRNADSLRQHPEKIALLGFSAGGHLAASLAVRWQDAALWKALCLSPEDVRPNAQVLCYPVITSGEHAHRGSFEALTGSKESTDHAPHSLETLVTGNVPPTFLWCSWQDAAVPCENTLLMAQALRRVDVPAEVHIFGTGGHGVSLGTEVTWGGDPARLAPDCALWPQLADHFLRRVFDKTEME